MDKFYLLQTVPTEKVSWVESHAATIGAIIVIILFIIERIFAIIEKRQDRRENWYYGIIVQPHITCINAFFQEYATLINDSHSQILNSLLSTNQNTLALLKAEYFAKLSQRIQDFDFEFLMIIYAYDLERHRILIETLRNMQDESVIALDAQGLSQAHLSGIVQNIKNQKSIFFNNLYQGLS